MNRKYILYDLAQLCIAYNDKNLPTCASMNYIGESECAVIYISERGTCKIVRTERLYFPEKYEILSDTMTEDFDKMKKLLA